MTAAGVGINELGEWVRTAATGGVLAILLGFWLRKRKDDRDGFGVLIEALQGDVRTVREQHKLCEDRLTEIEAQLRGMHRQRIQESSERAIAIGDPGSSAVQAAKRVMRIVDGDEEGNGGE